MNQARSGEPLQWQEVWIAELSSGFVVLLLLPAILWLVRRLPLDFQNWRRLAWHVPGFIVFTLTHVALFVALRKLWFSAVGKSYALDSPLWFSLLYEARIDLLTYLLVIGLGYTYVFVLDRLRGEASFPDVAAQRYPSQFLIKMLRSEHLVAVADIDWIASARNYVMLHCGDREYPMRCTMNAMQEQLNPSQFARVHRTAIVNLGATRELVELSGEASAILKDGTQVAVSASYLAALRERLASRATAT